MGDEMNEGFEIIDLDSLKGINNLNLNKININNKDLNENVMQELPPTVIIEQSIPVVEQPKEKPKDEYVPKRDAKGRWLKGFTGNKFGPMRDNRTVAFLRVMDKEKIAKVTDVLYAEAMKGDIKAAKLIYDHALKMQRLDVNLLPTEPLQENNYSKTELENLITQKYKCIKEQQERNEKQDLAEEFTRQRKEGVISEEKYKELINKYC